MKKLTIFLVLLYSQQLYPQGWIFIKKPYGPSFTLYRDSNNDFLLSNDLFIQKMDSDGKLISEEILHKYWFNNFYLTSNDEILLLETNGNETDYNNATVTLLDSQRQFQWEYQLPTEDIPDFTDTSGDYNDGTSAKAAIQDNEGNFFVVADFKNLVGSGPSDSYYDSAPLLLKITPEGEGTFLGRYRDTTPPLGYGFQFSLDIEALEDGFALLTKVQSHFDPHNFFPGFTKVSKTGEMIWNKYPTFAEYEGDSYSIDQVGNNLIATKEGNIVSTGIVFNNGSFLPYVLTLDNSGAIASFFPILIPDDSEESQYRYARDIQEYGDNYVVLYDKEISQTGGWAKNRVGFVVVDKQGKILLNRIFEELILTQVFKIMVLEEGGFLLIGGTVELIVIKTDSLGNCYPDTQFTPIDEGLGIYQFDNQSQYADSYLWEFGDGKTDTTAMASHQYQTIGTYEVCLTATNLCDSFKKCETIEVSEVTDIEAYRWEEGLLVYPNPVHNTELFVEIPHATELPELTLYNSVGKQLRKQYSNKALEVSELEAGIYYLQIEVERERTVRKVVVY